MQFNILCLQNKAKRLYIRSLTHFHSQIFFDEFTIFTTLSPASRLVLDGAWALLPSPSQSKVNMKQSNMCLDSEDILQLLHYKYDIIKERLYREMLQDEYGERKWTISQVETCSKRLPLMSSSRGWRYGLVGLYVTMATDWMCVWTGGICRTSLQTRGLAQNVRAARCPPVLQV